MNRPRLFLSAVSEELRTARQTVVATVRTLGFDPVSQDDFSTGYGELRQWLREQLDSCEGLIQLVGEGYGAEPPEVDPQYGRVSYTQFEFLYARNQNKKTWIIEITKKFGRDKPPAQLDLPRDADGHDPARYQAERQALQQDYIGRLKRDNHLRHTANSGTELQNIVLRLRDELSELRRTWEEWLTKDEAFKARTTAHLAELAEAGRLNTEKIRAHLFKTAEETHRREMAEAEAVPDWEKRKQLREAAEDMHRVRRSRIEELAASFAEMEGRGTSTSILQEMARILAEQGVDEAIAYVDTQRTSIFQAVRARTSAARERNRADLQPLLRTAALYQAKGQATETRTLFTEIITLEPDWPEALHAFKWFLTNQGDLALVRGTLGEAHRNYEEAHHIAQRLMTIDPGDTFWLRELGAAYSRLGNVAFGQGNLDGAAQAYLDGLVIAKQSAMINPDNKVCQRDLWAAYTHLGDVAFAKEQLGKAAKAYRHALYVAKQLAVDNPNNTDCQSDLSTAYDRFGNVARAQKRLKDAAQAYRKSLAIRETLAAIDPANNEWQHMLGVAYEQLGNMAAAQGKFEDATQVYRFSLAIAKQLAASDPGNTEWQRSLSVCYDKLGNVAVDQGKLEDAARYYRKSLAISKALARRDPDNVVWQRDLWVCYWRMADLAERRKKSGESRTYWKQAFVVLSRIENRGLHLSPEDRESLETLRRKAGANAD